MPGKAKMIPIILIYKIEETLSGKYLSIHTPARVIRDNIPIPTRELSIG
jgi:hypothetical protein